MKDVLRVPPMLALSAILSMNALAGPKPSTEAQAVSTSQAVAAMIKQLCSIRGSVCNQDTSSIGDYESIVGEKTLSDGAKVSYNGSTPIAAARIFEGDDGLDVKVTSTSDLDYEFAFNASNRGEWTAAFSYPDELGETTVGATCYVENIAVIGQDQVGSAISVSSSSNSSECQLPVDPASENIYYSPDKEAAAMTLRVMTGDLESVVYGILSGNAPPLGNLATNQLPRNV